MYKIHLFLFCLHQKAEIEEGGPVRHTATEPNFNHSVRWGVLAHHTVLQDDLFIKDVY